MPYKVKLDAFEGPLDLLLFLIKKSEVDIYDIPISEITKQYLAYIEIIQLLDIEAASDFILLAATLMRIKAQMLLPRPEIEELEEIDDPRQELVYRLLEYKRFKDVAVDLANKEDQARHFFPRGSFKIEHDGFDEELMVSGEVSLFDLVAAFKKIVEIRTKVSVHHVQDINVTLEERMTAVMVMIGQKSRVEFTELFSAEEDKIVLIVTFIAVLELIKQRRIRAVQTESFGRINIERMDG
jgi:segregation and condensation protein A